MRKAHREKRTSGIIGYHGGTSDDVAPSADSEPVKWDANVIAAISHRNQKSENRVGFNSSDAPKRGAIRCESNCNIDGKDARNVGRIGFAPRSGLLPRF